jgi:hypothetical protein
MRRLIALTSSEDEQMAAIACNGVLERAFRKLKGYDSAKEQPPRPKLAPLLLSSAELCQVEGALRLKVKAMQAPGGMSDGKQGD